MMPYPTMPLSRATWVVWPTGSTSKEIIKLDQDFANRHCGNSIIVLDVCENVASTKTMKILED